MLPDSSYATTELVAPCPFVSTPPDTEVYASVNNNQIQSGDSVSSTSIHFSYNIRNHFAPYAQFDCKLDDQPYQDCTIERCEAPGSCIPNSLEYGEIDFVSLEPGLHTFSVRATDDADNIDPTPAKFIWTIAKPVADAGENQIVKSNDLVSLDGSNSFDLDNSTLSYQWNQIDGPLVTLSDRSSSNPVFIAPEISEKTDIIFQLTVTNGEDTTSEPDEVTITISPITPPPTHEEPETIGDVLENILQNPLNIINSIDSVNQIKDILTDNNRGNDQFACKLLENLNSKDEANIRDILNC